MWNDELQYMHAITIVFIIFLVLDIVISPLKAVYMYGSLITNKKIIIRQYWKVSFWVDLISVVAVLIPYVHQGFYSNYLKLFFLPRVYTLYYNEKTLKSHLQTSNKLYLIYSIARIIVLMVMISHYIGIGFYMVDISVYENNSYGPNTPNYCWVYNAMAYSQMVINLPWFSQYIYTMYFSLATMTTIAYGDITPLNPK